MFPSCSPDRSPASANRPRGVVDRPAMEPTDEDLMEAYARRGERGAFDQLFRRHAGRLHGFFVRSTGRDDLAADFVQQTFLHVHRARADFRAGAPFRPWLYAIATNVRREHFRRAARRPEVPHDPERHPEPEQAPAAATASDRLLRRALAELPDAQREVLVLHWYEDLGFGEIAAMLGERETTVKVRAHRAYERLRERLGVPLARNRDPQRPVEDGG